MADSDENTVPEAKKNGPWPLIAAVVVMTLVAIWLVPGDQDDDSDPIAPVAEAPSLLPPAGSDQSAGQADEQTPAAQASATEQPSGPLGPGAAARALIAQLRQQNPPDLQRAFEGAQQHEQAGETDDAYLLYFYAAREGHGEAAMTLGRRSDPASFVDNGLLAAADELQANKWYLKAQNAGVTGAAEAVAKLRGSIENAAAQGDDRARRIMLQWK